MVATEVPVRTEAAAPERAPREPRDTRDPREFRPRRVVRDTRAWQLQVWISFAIAVFLCGVGLAWLPGADLDRAFMVMGYGFCLSSVFVLSKAIRDGEQARREQRPETPFWRFVVWGGFGLAMGLTAWGLLRMDIHPTYRAYLGVSWLYLVTTAFTLAKTLRDRHEADLAERGWGQ